MIQDKTTLILGAGASCHYGFPTGEGLIKKTRARADALVQQYKEDQKQGNTQVFQRAPSFFQVFSDLFYGYTEKQKNLREAYPPNNENKIFPKDAGDLKEKLCEFFSKINSLDPLNIDTFLRDQSSFLRNIGNYLIAETLLHCELECERVSKGQGNPENNWYRFLVHILAGCKDSDDLKKTFLKQQKLCIITFNYDVSLEYHLYNRLKEIEKFSDIDIAKDFMASFSENCIFHVYGALHKIDWNTSDPFENFGFSFLSNKKDLLRNYNYLEKELNALNASELIAIAKVAWQCSKNIRTIYQEKCDQKDPKWEEKRQKMIRHIHDSIRLVILGYGFDGENTRLLSGGGDIKGLKGWLDGDYYGAKNRLLLTNFNNSKRIEAKITKHERCSISTEKVYNALMHDFDLVS